MFRNLLRFSVQSLVWSLSVVATTSAFAAWPTQAYQATKMDAALQSLFPGSSLEESKAIVIKAPEIAENGAVVPVSVKSNLPGAEVMALFVSHNPYPLAANFKLTAANQHDVSTRLKFRESTDIIAVVKVGAKLYAASKNVKVTIGGCGGGSDTTTPGMSAGAESTQLTATAAEKPTKVDASMKVRSSMEGQNAQIKLLIEHPMETGLRKSPSGQIIPAHFIQQIVGYHNGKAIMAADWGIAIAKNPYLSFSLPNAKKGDKVVIEWIDNKNMTDKVEWVI